MTSATVTSVQSNNTTPPLIPIGGGGAPVAAAPAGAASQSYLHRMNHTLIKVRPDSPSFVFRALNLPF